jgi:hypothetical protein
MNRSDEIEKVQVDTQAGEPRFFDLFPEPIRGSLERIGITDRFIYTAWTLTRKPSLVFLADSKKYSGPFEFLSGSASLLAISIVILSFAPSNIEYNSLIDWVLKDQFIPWLFGYLTLIFISAVVIHVNIIVFPFLRRDSTASIPYKTYLKVGSYMAGWGHVFLIPFLFIETALEFLGIGVSGRIFDNMTNAILGAGQWSISIGLLDLDHRKVVKYIWWSVVYIPIFLIIGLVIGDFFPKGILFIAVVAFLAVCFRRKIMAWASNFFRSGH